ncbi:AAA family ATPase [Atribacter laminatus]|uniref:Protein CR006 P-loop domain-containing protein n=1 Tax=Atribacter laminatus TaxID=2847778 RepID=A0A7T1F396_ATRLM|nr:AAA family ATPase [Atribacter laminatus]QPM68612.1 hypothetical protein RT761_01834 [Atribacter laminatus]
MIKKIKFIGNLAVFKDFVWDNEAYDSNGNIETFKDINIIYGRNYSGKTTLSRILRGMETGKLSEKFENPSFKVVFADGTEITESILTQHGKKIRVFNEDFVRENLRFIVNPDDNIESFAILGEKNNKIEKEIEELESKLGTNEEGEETGLYAELREASKDFKNAKQDYESANDALSKQLSEKATDKNIGIKYRPERFGDQNYNIQKLQKDIEKVRDTNYKPPKDEQIIQSENLITEKTLQPVSPFFAPSLNFSALVIEAESFITKKISESEKIEELVKDAVLNRWVKEGRIYHKEKRNKCAFCGNPITEDRWLKLEKHFDKESEQLEKNIDALINKIEKEKSIVSSALSINKALFYSKFHGKLDELNNNLKEAVDNYTKSLDLMIDKLKNRKSDILNQKSFVRPDDTSGDLLFAWNSYEAIRSESDGFSTSLSSQQTIAKEALRIKEVSDYLLIIQYEERFSSIEKLKAKLEKVEHRKNQIKGEIHLKEERILSLRRKLSDEERGADKVNEYLNNFFGHSFLSLEAQKNKMVGEGSKQICYEITRDGKKAYHLSEGECSLIAFCYFIAKLNEIDTKNSKPIIWIDDPVSSLDANHIFFVYSLINAEIVSKKRFEQLFVSTHDLNFLKYLRRLCGKYVSVNGKEKDYQKCYFVVVRYGNASTICKMPKYLKEYATEFNYLFQQIHKCAEIDVVNDTNYTTFYNFANNARKFLEIYLYYKYPDKGMSDDTLRCFFGEKMIPAILTDRINNEYSHCAVLERGATPIEVPEMQAAARLIIERLKRDREQYSSLLRSIGEDKVPEMQE